MRNYIPGKNMSTYHPENRCEADGVGCGRASFTTLATLPPSARLFVMCFHHYVAAHGRQNGYAQRDTHFGAATVNSSNSLTLSTVAIERSDADSFGDWSARELTRYPAAALRHCLGIWVRIPSTTASPGSRDSKEAV